ncbi:MAG TPA: methionine--tRNA ligase [Candidatus Paceibacterota bacterium]|nr:methionine--tRNA ligase [Candidatus Paceibacterota bacterium]
MEEKQALKKFYITTAIHYANAAPHVGHAYEGVLADILARYQRGRGAETFFLTGTDEHGQKIVRAAEKAGVGPQAFVDENAAKFQKLYEDLHLSNNAFIRTSNKEAHWAGAEELWKRLSNAGDIYRDTYDGLYCVGCESFVTEKELVDGKCPDHNEEPQVVEEENYFFRASKYQEQLITLIEKDELRILPDARKEETLAFLKAPLQDPSFSRPEGSVPWGIPVPGDPTQMMYVWCDALANYISALGFGKAGEDEKFQKFWPADVHVIGKDILRFHAVFWPAMLLSAELPLPKTLLVHGHLISGGRKMSKTLGNVIDPQYFIKKYGSEAFRHYLGHEISPFHDGDFTEEKFIESYNGNLANGIGNLLSRTVAMAQKYFDGSVMYDENISVPMRRKLGGFAEEEAPVFHIPYYFDQFVLPEYQREMEALEINKAAGVAWRFAAALDEYISDYEPFKLVKTDAKKTEQVLWQVLFGISKLAELLQPFLPETGEKMHHALGVQDDIEVNSETVFHTEPLPEPLFQKVNVS